MPPTPENARWFSQEVQPCEETLRSYLRRALPTSADVDDTLQDCYIRILRAHERGQVRSTRPLLFAIARNLVREFFTHRFQRPQVAMAEVEADELAEEKINVVEAVCHQQELALLMDAIDSLPTRCREIMLLRKVKGLSQRRIAELLGITENTVENQVVKGARRCAEFLRAKGALSHLSDAR